MTIKFLFTITALFYLVFSLDAHSAAAADADADADPSVRKIFTKTRLPGNLIQVDIIPPARSDYFSLICSEQRMRLCSGTIYKKEGKSLPISCVEEIIAGGSGVVEDDDLLIANLTDKLENTVGVFKATQSIDLKARQLEMNQAGFVWGSGAEDYCMLSALEDYASPLRGIQLFGKEKNSEGQFVALLYGAIDFTEYNFNRILKASPHPDTPDPFSEGLTVAGCAGIRLIIEDT